ncbi:helix-turn-helix domain-containing protein [Thiocystis violascens]|uniref:Uncharacterized protein n=1 Tax=Thiocystis violascens (strain ATCC 17096 / DSM 198 / 6111) TaxID=765911 RepID=I3YEG1_THIV6|nr:helix-turn-helix domain-containing protein [Thiocystis violascens]AFL75379.1 hypothetical protein Thivi_3512 [Thiocystis violascens DSM 198]
MSNLILTPINGEPRIQDLQLAERLGFERPRKIRDLIQRNLEKLSQISVCPTMGQTSGELGGRPTKAYYLNEKQSLFLCMKADTVNAFAVQMEIIDVYSAYRRGDLASPAQPSVPETLTFSGSWQDYALFLEAKHGRSYRAPAPIAHVAAPVKPGPRPVTPEEAAEVLDRFTAGASRYAIGKALGRNSRTINRILARANADRAPQMALRLLAEGQS